MKDRILNLLGRNHDRVSRMCFIAIMAFFVLNITACVRTIDRNIYTTVEKGRCPKG